MFKKKNDAVVPKTKPPVYKRKWFIGTATILCLVGIGSVFGSKDAAPESAITDDVSIQESADAHDSLYSGAVTKDVLSGTRDKKLGEYSYAEVLSSDVTDASLAEYYFDYYVKNDFNFGIIIYTDTNPDNPTGIQVNEGIISKDVIFSKNEYGEYYVTDSSGSTMYLTIDDEGYIITDEEFREMHNSD